MLFVLVLGWSVFPAHAQVHPCNGSGPGEVMVGEQPGGNGIAPIPLCQYVDNGSYQQAPPAPVRLPDVYMAVVTHPDTNLVWSATGYANEKQAEQVAMDACAKAMGEGCGVAAGWSNQAVIIVVADVAGNLFVNGDGDARKAQKLAMGDCEKYSTGCQLMKVVVNGMAGGANYFPATFPGRRLFASVARPKGTPPEKWDDKAWLATGQGGYKAAEDAVLTQCAHDTGMECEIRVTVGNGLIARSLDDQGHIYWLNASAPAIVERIVRSSCPKERECRLVDTFDARTPRTAVIDVSGSEAPARGFYSLARPVDDAAEKAWGKRAIVTGRTTRAEAQAQAVELCEAESKMHCEATPKEGDSGISQMMLLVRDSTGKPSVFFGSSKDDVKNQKEKYCAKNNVSCPGGEVVDLAKPAKTTVSI
nr:DUF4189 domain-containing protein [Dyella sp. ASV24]